MNNLMIGMDERKTKIAEKLSSQYAVNIISIEEYERLVEYSQKIETESELLILEKIVNERNVTEPPREKKPIPQYIEREFTNVLSTREISGPMVGGIITNILGETKIILDEDDLINDETTLHVSSVLGSIDIRLSGNINVVCKVIPILGEARNKYKKAAGNGKTLIINGNVILGDIKIK